MPIAGHCQLYRSRLNLGLRGRSTSRTTFAGARFAGARDRALFRIGFAGALCRSEPVGLDAAHVTWTDEGLTLLIERAKTDF